ncbi:diguanylate cyclase domain-containing protein [Paenibacillus bouchesdurhonensis]|uniref:diguanylate cyclase domain-containing protein n=1 Tax=Paenibacillus bouchesdurhonensis TaxID=1870990 RepID=UPI000DA60855|nr:diguanylate cyclase [Paenibacillus bouchesdurhonensis]
MINIQLTFYGLLLSMMLILATIGAMMYFRWRSQLYVNLFGATLLGAISSIAMLAISNKFTSWYAFFLSLLTCSFVLMQIALHRLLFTKRQDKLYGHLIGTGASLITAAASLFLPVEMAALLLLFVIAGLAGFMIYKIFPETGSKPKIMISFLCYALHLIFFISAAITKINGLHVLGMLVLFFSMYMIFTQLMERVLDIMQAAAFTSTRDEATGLYTRKHFVQQANHYLSRGQAFGVVYILIDFSKENRSGSYDEQFNNIGPIIQKYIDRLGFSCRYGQDGVAVIITKSSLEMANLVESLRMNIKGEVPYPIAVGYTKVIEGAELEQLLHDARQDADRIKSNGLDKIFDLANSKILSHDGNGGGRV